MPLYLLKLFFLIISENIFKLNLKSIQIDLKLC